MKWMIPALAVIAAAGCGGKSPGGTNEALPPVTMFSPDTANLQDAQFSPDWSHLYWWQSIGAARQLFMADTGFKSVTALPPVTVLGGVVPIWSPDGKEIAVPTADSGSGVSAIMVMAPDGSGARRLSLPPGLYVPASWHPRGDSLDLIATSGGSIHGFVTSATAGGLRPLIPGLAGAYIGFRSPDGARIAYSAFDKGLSTIWVADSDGGHQRQLTHDGFEGFGNIEEGPWSPDSRTIAYQSNRTGTSDIWVVAADSGLPRQITRDVRNDTWPVWSPDGKWIAFLSDRGKQTDLWVVADTGGPAFRITNDAMPEQPGAWRRGTLQFAYLTGQGNSGIWRMSVGDGSEQRLTPDSVRAGKPILSPDGTQIAFQIDHGGGIEDIAITPATGGTLRTLVSGGADSTVTWSPDGTRLAFISDRGGTRDVWVANVADGKLIQLDNWPGDEFSPAWNADGSAIYFQSDHDARLDDIWQVPAAGGTPIRVTTEGSVGLPVTRRGLAALFTNVIGSDGQFSTIRVGPAGKLTTVWKLGNTFPVDILPRGDSLIIAEIRPGGQFGFRLVPANPSGAGAGRELLSAGQLFQSLSDDGTTILYALPNGATHDIGLLNRADGTTRRLTNTPEDESGAVMSPDGKTVYFLRSRAVRRVAVADLTKLLGK
ncbi:MAG: hypothetical protein ACREL5_04230 [Gemmatimonadales bacterium]